MTHSLLRNAVLVLPLIGLVGCGGGGSSGGGGILSRTGLNSTAFTSDLAREDDSLIGGFIGGVAADEPQAAMAARDVLAHGGTAADAVVAGALMMTVTMPSRAGLMGGGACLAYSVERRQVDSFVFAPGAPASTAGADRPAAVPMMARGLYMLGARHGSRPFEVLLKPAEDAARSGVRVTRAFAQDLAAVARPLFADPQARKIFSTADGAPLTEGATLTQPELAASLARIRTGGVGDLYQGTFAQMIAEQSPRVGARLSAGEMRQALPQTSAPLTVKVGDDVVHVVPTAGGQQTADALRAGNDGQAIGGTLPASVGLVTLDRHGNAVSCAFTMNNLFGTGRMLPDTGLVLAAAPSGAIQPPLLSTAIATNERANRFRAAVAGTGQAGAAAAAATAMRAALANQPVQVADPGRADTISCARYLPGSESRCTWMVDPRLSGLAIGETP